MSDLIGQTLGHYQIVEQIGSGGMGEVYRARDTTLDREVALKLLLEKLADNPERLARLKREARTLASLNHPTIATLHELGEDDGKHFVVMELVEGDTLAERLRRGPLPLAEALGIAQQIATALEVAHEGGVIHRDLKPANVKLTPNGQIKLLDFGLAKVSTLDSVFDSKAPTESVYRTGTGMIMGTAPYMSPEQARGDEVDKRTDVWAFGCVLFELLTGRRTFAGASSSDVLAGVLEREPDWNALPSETPVPIQALLRRCLNKDPKDRLHDIADARIELEEVLAEPETAVSTTSPLRASARGHWQKTLWAVGGLIFGAIFVVAVAWLMQSSSPPVAHKETRLSIVPSLDAPVRAIWNTGVVALSPDGTQLVYVATVDEEVKLYLRPLNRLEATPIPGTEGAVSPFFSPDGQWIGFRADRKLHKVSLQGGQRITISAGGYRGASWGEDDTILFARDTSSGLFRVSANGGTPQAVTTPDAEVSHRWPQILPGGKAALFTIQATSGRHEECRIAILSLETGEWRVLFEGGTLARYVASGHVIYTRYGSLLAVPFDLESLEITGKAVVMFEDVAMFMYGAAYLAVSDTGSLAYVRRRWAPLERSLVWIDRQGQTTHVPGARRAYRSLDLSSDGTRLAVNIMESDAEDVWVYDLRQQTWARLTFGKDNYFAVWSPSDRWLAFASNRDGPPNLFKVPADGSGTPERLRTSPYFEFPTDWSPDGRFLLFNTQPGGQSYDLWVLPFEEGEEARSFIATPFLEDEGQFSPDGRWVAFYSSESGRWEVYVRSFPDPGRKTTVSRSGGVLPLWSPDGRELFFMSLDFKRVMVAAVQTEPTFKAEPPRLLFESESPIDDINITPDGQRFIAILDDAEKPDPDQIVVIPDFAEELKAKFREADQ